MGRKTHIHIVIETRTHAHKQENGEKENQQVKDPAAVEQDCTTEEEYKTQQGQREDQSWVFTTRLSSTLVCNAGFLEQFDWPRSAN